MPCLNEESTVGICIEEAKEFLRRQNQTNHTNKITGEILVVDNGSTDHSARVAALHGARVIHENRRGYGRALRTGIAHCKGRIIIYGDCDTTYDFNHLEPMYLPLARGSCDVMIGDRFAGGIEKGAMPLLHRWGVPFLSLCGRLRWKIPARDFHCGIRGLTRDAAMQMELKTTGMEFATEFIAEAVRKHLHIGQVPIPLRRCTQKRSSKLRTFKDGARHMRYILKNLPDGIWHL